ncbi:molybdenum cofactor guanylyltransferase [Paracoccus suum]|uniref:Molybdenum cofactor guanylyltransferase n=1 Tax=Paracoccus suum TaxID=2259340 RepID=A0A344PI50_9RHOB|nr:molybdenum cofactor guanylyltransferase MobA [Paracoccus suum]AXC49055.1 molybdenum cofactor guanylyltransferase [Paracoccus suum]
MTQPIHDKDIAGIILAGGQGTRMGGADKALLVLHDRPLIAHVVDRLGCARAISANGPAERFAGLGLPVLPDTLSGHPGPLAGVLAGLEWAAAQGFGAIVTAATDTPGFPRDLAAMLAHRAAGSGDAAVILVRGISSPDPGGAPRMQPTFALWRTSAAPGVRAALAAGTRRVEAVAQLLGMETLDVPGSGAFFNINTAQDLARAGEFVA